MYCDEGVDTKEKKKLEVLPVDEEVKRSRSHAAERLCESRGKRVKREEKKREKAMGDARKQSSSHSRKGQTRQEDTGKASVAQIKERGKTSV